MMQHAGDDGDSARAGRGGGRGRGGAHRRDGEPPTPSVVAPRARGRRARRRRRAAATAATLGNGASAARGATRMPRATVRGAALARDVGRVASSSAAGHPGRREPRARPLVLARIDSLSGFKGGCNRSRHACFATGPTARQDTLQSSRSDVWIDNAALTEAPRRLVARVRGGPVRIVRSRDPVCRPAFATQPFGAPSSRHLSVPPFRRPSSAGDGAAVGGDWSRDIGVGSMHRLPIVRARRMTRGVGAGVLRGPERDPPTTQSFARRTSPSRQASAPRPNRAAGRALRELSETPCRSRDLLGSASAVARPAADERTAFSASSDRRRRAIARVG